jgi:hypothetical protein
MSRVIRSEHIYTLTDYGARVAVGIVDRKSPWPQDLNDDEKQALRRLQRDKYVIVHHVHGQAFESLVAKGIVIKETSDAMYRSCFATGSRRMSGFSRM